MPPNGMKRASLALACLQLLSGGCAVQSLGVKSQEAARAEARAAALKSAADFSAADAILTNCPAYADPALGKRTWTNRNRPQIPLAMPGTTQALRSWADLQRLATSGAYEPRACAAQGVHPPPAPQGVPYLPVSVDVPVRIELESTLGYGDKVLPNFTPSTRYCTYDYREGTTHCFGTYVPDVHVPEGYVTETAYVNGFKSAYAILVPTERKPPPPAPGATLVADLLLEGCAGYANDQATVARLAKARADRLAARRRDLRTKFAADNRKLLTAATQRALAAGQWASVDEYLSHAPEFHARRAKLEAVNHPPLPSEPAARQKEFERRLGLMAEINRREMTDILSRGIATATEAKNLIVRLLGDYPESENSQQLATLGLLMDQGPMPSDNLTPSFEGWKKNFAYRREHPETGKISSEPPVPEEQPVVIDAGNDVQCLRSYPALWTRIEQRIRKDLADLDRKPSAGDFFLPLF